MKRARTERCCSNEPQISANANRPAHFSREGDFSSQPVFNPDYAIRGIPYVAIIAPDGTVRHAGLHPGSPLAEKTAKIDAILKEFKLSVPATNS